LSARLPGEAPTEAEAVADGELTGVVEAGGCANAVNASTIEQIQTVNFFIFILWQ